MVVLVFSTMEIRRLEFEVEEGLGRIRLDDYLFKKLSMLSRMYVRELVKTERVVVNGAAANVGIRLRARDFIEIEADLSRGTSMRPEAIPLDVVYEDAHIIVINKPAGMLVHPTHRDKSGTLLNALTYYLNAECGVRNAESKPVVRPGLVHRLDRETSGLIAIAKTLPAHRRLAADFMKRRVEKRYVALVEGSLQEPQGVMEHSIGRFADKKSWDVRTDGKAASTRFRVIERRDDTTLLELEPITGRTNQLRIHCAAIGHAIIGDTARGGRPQSRLLLHAWKLALRHPFTRDALELSSEVPKEFK